MELSHDYSALLHLGKTTTGVLIQIACSGHYLTQLFHLDKGQDCT